MYSDIKDIKPAVVRHRVGIIIRLCKYGTWKYRAGADAPSISRRKKIPALRLRS